MSSGDVDIPMFWRNMLPSTFGQKSKMHKKREVQIYGKQDSN
jgi:hypothetical protein